MSGDPAEAVRSAEIAQPQSPVRPADRPRIIWADDNADMREYVSRLLAPAYDVRAVADGEAALSAALSEPPDLVLTDVMMPRMDGVELLRKLRSDPRTREVPVILLSARAAEEAKVKGLQTGADDYLIKPFSAPELLARVAARLELARVRQAALLREKELREELANILEGMTDGFMALDRDSRITYVNAAAEKTNKITKERLLGRIFWEAFPGVLGTDFERGLRRAMTERVSVRGEAFYPPYNRWFEMDVQPTQNGGLAFYGRDITARKQTEEALNASERELAAELASMGRLQEVSTRLVQAKDPVSLLEEILAATIEITSADKGNIQLLNRATGALTIIASRGFETPFLGYFNTVHSGQAACGAAMERGARVIVEDVKTSPLFADTTALEVLLAAGVQAVQSTPLVSRSGRLVGMLSTHYSTPRRPSERDLRVLDQLARQAADWIERTQAEESLRQSEERFRRLFELGTLGRAITSPTMGTLEVNEGLCKILGYDRAELLQKSWPELTHPDDLAADVERFNRVMAGEIDGYSMDKRWIRKDGGGVDTTLWVNCVRDENGAVDYFVALVLDITDRKRADHALRKSEERYRSLIAQVKDFAIFSSDERGVVKTWNEGCQYVLGYGQHEFIGLDTAELFTAEDRAQGVPAAELRQAREAGTVGTEHWMIARGGRRFFAMGATAALRDSAGRVIGFSTVLRDVTRMKESQDQLAQRGESLQRLVTERTGELEETTERLRISERMAALGTLAAGLGHDMGNLLLPMDVRLDLLIEADLPRELHEHVVGIQKCAHYLQRLSSGLRLLATDPAHVESRGATDLGRWWADVRIILKAVLPAGTRFEHHLPDSESWVALGRTGLTQAVYNLVQNAADAIKEHGGSRVRVSAEDDASSPWVVIRVTDDGPGMTEEVARHCMEPYFSTKARGDSTGMGLALVHAVVTGAGGQVEVESAPGRGTTFSLLLPRALP